MVSLSRRQVLIGGAVSALAPSIGFACAQAEKLVLSGRVVSQGNPVAGATFAIGGHSVTTDADGRFLLVADTRAYPAANVSRDGEGTRRATLALTL